MTIDEIAIHYRVFEPIVDPVGKMLLLHGLGGSTYSFESSALALSGLGYSVVAVDLPGFGFSEVGVDFQHTLENRSGLLWRFLDRLDGEHSFFPPTVPWFVVGHDTGAQTAVLLALELPARTAGLIVVAGALDEESFPLCCIWFPPVRWGLRSWLANGVFTYSGVEELLSDAYGREATPLEVDGYLAPLLRDDMAHSFARFLATSSPWEFALEQITVPTLVVWGSEDSWLDPELGSSIASRIPGASLKVIDSAGHMPLETHNGEALQIISQWLLGL